MSTSRLKCSGNQDVLAGRDLDRTGGKKRQTRVYVRSDREVLELEGKDLDLDANKKLRNEHKKKGEAVGIGNKTRYPCIPGQTEK